MPELETVDVPGVEILSAGGPVHGVGSPPEGDYWSADDLEGIAAANRELAGELKAPSKIGHSAAQLLLNNSGVKAPTPGEMPAVGWLDGTSFRVEERDGVAKLFADVKAVPKQFADLLNAKAYSTRSVELSRVSSQEIQVDGKPKVFEWVVTGLAWLGAKLPAVRTLDEIVALYEHEDLEKPDARVFVVYAAGDVVWDPEAGFQDLRDDVAEALNGPYSGGMNEPRFWVADVAVSGDKALVQDYYDDGSDGWVVPFARNADDSITIAPSSDWTQVERGWVEAAREMAQRSIAFLEARADIRRTMPETKYTDEQRRKFADAIPGDTLKVEDVTDEMLANAGVAVVEEPKVDADKQLEDDKSRRDLEARVEKTERELAEERKELHEERKRNFVEGLVTARKITPGDSDKWAKRYDADPQAAREYAEDLEVHDELDREYGADSDEILDDDALEAQNKSYAEETSARIGIPVDQVI